MTTLPQLLDKFSGTAIILPEDGTRVSYADLREQVADAANVFAGLGIGRGDRVAMALPNGLAAIVCFLGAAVAGTAAPLNPAYREEEFRFYLEDTNAKLLVLPEDGAEAARAAAGDSVPVITVGVVDGRVRFLSFGSSAPAVQGESDGVLRPSSTPAGVSAAQDDSELLRSSSTPEPALSVRSGVSAAQDDRERSSASHPAPDDVALVLHTSGSTGRPKRVPLKQANLVTSIYNIIDTYELGTDDVSLCVMPLFHVHGLMASLMSTLASGGTVVVPAKFNPMSFWRTVREFGVTWYSAVPTMHQLLLARVRTGETVDAGKLRFIRSCSASLAPETMASMESAFGVPVLEAYGMTEASHQMASNPLPPGDRRPGSVGAGTGVGIGIMDKEGNLLAAGEHGEVVIQGRNVIDGYESNPEANATSFTNGWFRTGDQGFLDENGYLTLVARIKEMINRGGEKISPREIDEVLMRHPAVAEAVCFGVPHKMWGEEVAVAVVLREGASASEAEIMAYCQNRLADFKSPKKIHIVTSIPRTATGKLQRRAVAATYGGSES